MKTATITDVALKAGVSVSTVSRYINENGPVSLKNQQRIKKTMIDLNYIPNSIARSLKLKNSKSVAVFFPDMGNQFYSEIFAGLVSIAESLGYFIVTCSTHDEAKFEIAHIQQLLSRNIDGLIFFTYGGIRNDLGYIQKLSEKIPIVFMDPVFENETVPLVTTDGFLGTKHAINYLVGKGHRKIAYIKTSSNYLVTKNRYNGYLAALQENGIPFNSNYIYEIELDDLLERGFMAGNYFLQLENPPTAIVAIDDMVAIGCMNSLKSQDVKIPEDIAIIGFDNIPLSRLVTPPLTTVSQPIRQLGEEALKLLIQKIENPESINRKVYLDTKLVIRRSTELEMPAVCRDTCE